MSYIGRLPIKIPEEVSILVEKDNKSITVKGPHGELSVAEISGITKTQIQKRQCFMYL